MNNTTTADPSLSAAQAAANPVASSTAAPANKLLMAAVGVLSAAVLALGGTMLYQQGAQNAWTAGAARTVAPATAMADASQKWVAAPQASNNAADDLVDQPVAAEAKKAVTQPAPATANAVAPRHAAVTPAPRPAPAYSRAPQESARITRAGTPASFCASCGTVESVNAVQRATKPAPISVGSVAGGVVGAALGNQVGRGNGRTLATVLGAVGGGYAGHVIEGQVRKVTVYQVSVRMEDGSRCTIEAPSAPAIGSRVTVDGNTLQGQGSGAYSNTSRPAPVSVQYSPEVSR